MEGLIAREIEIARELIAAKKRERALLALRKKKLREGQLEQIDAYLLNVEQARAACMHHALTIRTTALRNTYAMYAPVSASQHGFVAPYSSARLPQVLANIETAQRQNRLYDALKQGNTALAALQQARC